MQLLDFLAALYRIMPSAKTPGRVRCIPIAATAQQLRKRDYLMTDHAPMEITVRESPGDVYVLEVRGRLTIGEPSDQLNDALQAVVKRGGRKVVVNLNNVPQIDSSGISSLVRVSIHLAREGGAVHLVCGPGRVRDSLTVTRLIEAIPTFETESAALAKFN